MTLHLLRLVWNRKGQNLLIVVEILLSFLVLFGVLLFTVNYVNNWRRTLGFDVDRVWSIRVRYPTADVPRTSHDDPVESARLSASFRALFAALDSLPQIEKSAAVFPSVPYSNSTWSTGLGLEGEREVNTVANMVTDDFGDVFKVRLLAGRWFSGDDDVAVWQPVVINQRLAHELFGDRDPVNELIPLSAQYIEKQTTHRPMRVVGVVEDFRHLGEFSMPGNFMFRRLRLDATEGTTGFSGRLAGANFGGNGPPNALVIRLADGTTAAFEETLVTTLHSVAPDWSFEVRPIVDMRTDHLRSYTAPLVAVGTVAGFLLLMVVLGLTGVLWQSVTRRTQEFGLRRAQGASVSHVRRQIFTEIVLLTSLALTLGVALVAQLPLLPFNFNANRHAPPIPLGVFAASIAVSVAVVYLLTLLCSWYPSRLATRIQPADALHYE